MAALDGAKYSKWFTVQSLWSLESLLIYTEKIIEAQNVGLEWNKDYLVRNSYFTKTLNYLPKVPQLVDSAYVWLLGKNKYE